MRLRNVAAGMAVALAASGGAAQTPHSDHAAGSRGHTIAVENAWARASAGRTGAAYVTLVNRGEHDDRLVAVRSEAAARLSLHTHKVDGDIMRMRPVEAIRVPAGGTVTFEPGGYHVMLVDLERRLAEGDTFPLTLVFERAGDLTVTVPVLKMGATGPATSHGHDTGH